MAANKIKCMTDVEDSASTSDSDCSVSKNSRTMPPRAAAARAMKPLLDSSEEETGSESDQEHRRRRASKTPKRTCLRFRRCIVESDSDSESVVTVSKEAQNNLSHRQLQECRVVLTNCVAEANAYLRSPCLDRPLPQTVHQPRSSDSDSDSAFETLVSKKRKRDASSVASPARKTKPLNDSEDTSKLGTEYNNCKFSSHHVNRGNQSKDESLDSPCPRLATNSCRCVVESDSDSSSSPESVVKVLKGGQNTFSHRQLKECRIVLTHCVAEVNAYLRSPCPDRPLPRTALQRRNCDSDSDLTFETLVSKKLKSDVSLVVSPPARKTKELSDSEDNSNSGIEYNNCKFSSHHINGGNKSKDKSLVSSCPRLATNSRRCIVELDSSSSPESVVTVLKGAQNTFSCRQVKECRVVLTNCVAKANAYLMSPCLDRPLPRTAHQPRSSGSESDSAFETLVSKKRKSDVSFVVSPPAKKTKELSDSEDTSNSESEYNNCNFSSSGESSLSKKNGAQFSDSGSSLSDNKSVIKHRMNKRNSSQRPKATDQKRKQVRSSSNDNWEDLGTVRRKKLTRRSKIYTRNQGKRSVRYDDEENASQSE